MSKAPFEMPRRLRAMVRARESSLIALAAAVGAIAGLVVAIMGLGVDSLHRLFFGLAWGERLSATIKLDPWVAFCVPFFGGILFGVAIELIGRWRRGREVDPIEANALHGGRMSIRGSLIVAAQTVWSSGVGASVGLEAGYTQLASGIASRIGRAFPPAPRRSAHPGRLRRRRRDRRRVRGAAGRRLLRLRADHRQLFGHQPGAGRDRRADRLSGRRGIFACRVRRCRLTGDQSRRRS